MRSSTKRKILSAVAEGFEGRGEEFSKLFVEFVKLWADRFARQAGDFVRDLENNPQTVPIIKLSDEEEAAFAATLSDTLERIHLLGMTIQDAETRHELAIGLSLDIQNADAEAYARDHAGELIANVDETTRAEIAELVESSIRENRSIADIAAAIRERFDEYSTYRATLIAVMEAGNAYEVGKRNQFDQYARQFGTVGWKRSQTQHDSAVRDSHRANEEEGWIPANQLFAATQTDHAPHGFNCRCVTAYRLTKPV